MIASIFFRGLPSTATATAATTASLVTSVLAALLHVACSAGEFICDSIRTTVAHVTALFRATDPASSTPATARSSAAATYTDSGPVDPHSSSTRAPSTTRPATGASVPSLVHTTTANMADERPITSWYATHHVVARRAAVDPNLPDIIERDVLPAFDELLLPPPLARPLDDAARARRLDFYAQSYFLQSHLARDRIREAYREEQRQAAAVDATAAASNAVEDPLQDPAPYTSFACGCGWCPNGTAAYPLCAAVTIRRRLRRDSGDRYKSVARDLSRRQSLYGHHVDAAAIFAGRTRG